MKGNNLFVKKAAKAITKGFVVGGKQGAFNHGKGPVRLIYTKQMLGKKQYTPKLISRRARPCYTTSHDNLE
jgi:hypothetical protein